MTQDCIRVLLVDDQALFREGLGTLLAAQPGVEVVGEAANGEEAHQHSRQAGRARPDAGRAQGPRAGTRLAAVAPRRPEQSSRAIRCGDRVTVTPKSVTQDMTFGTRPPTPAWVAWCQDMDARADRTREEAHMRSSDSSAAPGPESPTYRPANGGRDRFLMGAALIAFGALSLASQLVKSEQVGLLLMPTLAVMFLAWGIATRTPGLMIPGGILGGLGLGIILLSGPFEQLEQGSAAAGGVFLLSLALGFGAVTVLSRLFTRYTHWWALIPGSILAALGGAILADGLALRALELLGVAWPLGLVGFGLYVLLRPNRPARGSASRASRAPGAPTARQGGLPCPTFSDSTSYRNAQEVHDGR